MVYRAGMVHRSWFPEALEGERVVLYVESDGTILDASDAEFADYERETGEWSELVKIYSDEDAGDGE